MSESLPLHDSAQWPLRMRADEVACVLRISRRSLYDRIASGRFPRSDDGRTWARDVVERYLGNIKQWEKNGRRQAGVVAGGFR